MATTIEELRAVMRMELKPFMRDLQQMNGISAKAARQVEQTWRNANRRLDGIGKNMAQSLIAPLTGVGAALGARELIRLTDVWTDLNGRVRIAAGGMREGTDVMARLSDMARRTYSSLETTAESYLTNSNALKELGYNTNQQLDFTEALNNALVVSGAKGQRAEQVINALGKAMAFGELRGENLNTVIQTGGRVAQALAEGLGVTTNELRKMGEQGKLKSSNVFTALTSQMQTLRDEADGMQATIGDAIQLLQNSFLEYVGGADQAAGASARVAEAIILLADNMDTAANAALFAAQAIIGALAGRAMVGAGIQIVNTSKALAEFVRIARAAQGLGGLGPAFASLGANAGLIGAVVGGAAALALGHFAGQAIEAGQRTERVNAELERMGIVARDAADGLNEADAALTEVATAKSIADQQQKIEEMEASLRDAEKAWSDTAGQILAADEAAGGYGRTASDANGQMVKELGEALRQFDGTTESAAKLKAELDRISVAMPDFAQDSAGLIVFAQRVANLTSGLALLRGEMEKIGTPTVPQQNHNAFLAADNASMAPIIAGQSWLSEQNRRNALTREQRDLEDEILRIRKEMESAEPGAILSDGQIETLAKGRLAAQASGRSSGSGSKADPYGDALNDMQRRVDFLYPEQIGMAA
jgi:tape measure domain-containing protein